MKVIDLLNKIANGEEVPKKIKMNGIIFEYKGDDYLFIDKDNTNWWLFSEPYSDRFSYLESFLKTEVEVTEEDKKIEYIEGRIKNGKHYIEDSCFRVRPLEDLELNQNEIVIIDKINEIIKKINKE